MFVLSRYVVTHRDQNLQVDSSASSALTASGLFSSSTVSFAMEAFPSTMVRRCTICSRMSDKSFRMVCHLIAIL